MKKGLPLQSHSGNNRGVAQLASASGLGPEGPVFESQYPDIKRDKLYSLSLFLFQPFAVFEIIILAGWAQSVDRDGFRGISPLCKRSHSSNDGSQHRVRPFSENDDFKMRDLGPVIDV